MKYEKKIIILSEVNSGFSRSQVRATLTIEKSALGTRCVFVAFNLRDMENGEYLLGVTLKDARTEVKNLGRDGRINAVFDLNKDSSLDGKISVVLAYAKDGTACAVAYGSNDNKRIWEANMLDGIIRTPQFFTPAKSQKPQNDQLKTILQNKEGEFENTIQSTKTKNDEKAPSQTPLFLDIITNSDYVDSAVAVENYYPKDYGENLSDVAFTATKKSAFSGLKPYKLRQQSVEPDEHKTQTQSLVAPTNAEYIDEDLPSPPKIPNLDEFELSHSQQSAKTVTQQRESETTVPPRYYEQIRTQIDELFTKFPPAEDINELLPDTRWVKVDYDGSGRFYVIGLIGDEPSYVAYGVPAKYSKNPPKELEGYCQWFPLDYKNPQADGYWLMYQDANSGDCVDVEII